MYDNKSLLIMNIVFTLSFSSFHLPPPFPPPLSENDDDVGGSPSSSHSLKKHFRFPPFMATRDHEHWCYRKWGVGVGGTYPHRCTQRLNCTFKCGHMDAHTHDSLVCDGGLACDSVWLLRGLLGPRLRERGVLWRFKDVLCSEDICLYANVQVYYNKLPHGPIWAFFSCM